MLTHLPYALSILTYHDEFAGERYGCGIARDLAGFWAGDCGAAGGGVGFFERDYVVDCLWRVGD